MCHIVGSKSTCGQTSGKGWSPKLAPVHRATCHRKSTHLIEIAELWRQSPCSLEVCLCANWSANQIPERTHVWWKCTGIRGIMIRNALHPKSWADDQRKNAQMQTHCCPSTNQRRPFARLRDGTTGEQRSTFHWQHKHQINYAGTLFLCKVECSLLMYAENQALYISSLVRPTFRTHVVEKLAMCPSSMASVTSSIELSAVVIYNDSNQVTKKMGCWANKMCVLTGYNTDPKQV